MTKSKFDAIVIGAGMSGNAAAYSMARRGLKVLQLERGEHSGSKNVQGAILYANMLEAIIPNFRDDAPLERHLVEQRFWLMDDSSHTGVHYRSDDFNELKPNRYTIIRAQFDKWFSSKVREAGGTVLCETTATKLARDRSGSVIGVYTDREGGVILADVVVLAEGVNGLLGTRAGLRDMPKPENVALAVKEMHFMPEEVIAERFGLNGSEGCVIEAGGTISRGMAGLGFLYTNKESISVGIGCLVSGLAEGMENPYRLLDAFKQHPSIRPLLAGSEIKEYAAHLIPEGGFKAIPQLFGNGWVVVGDAAQLNNAVHREGSNLAMTSGLMAGEAIFQIKSRGGLMTKRNLSLYKGILDKSFVMKDLIKHKDLPSLLHTDSNNFFMTYPTLISQAAQNFVRVDGAPKINREKATAASFINARSRWGLISDAVRSAVSWR
ncbi:MULTISPECIES: FAD-dependent oxidoreductase [Rhizobium]|uniref:Protein FixC n=1 Tax=Rhizobium esperanzae TaxID=1967781 RepID=A0A7W6UNV4_9HYPH|nr:MULTISPECIES: FAD-dependent oxidoreductase [Rhizobium]ASS60198.1 FAD-dependent oxidoreductase [Rhizobium leguminosarum bv. viciae]MBB4342858.1 electron transfer flavoprotein-quinone oxidoreductase [Rhizobium leguminosarum]MBB4441536.1 electron transfer flavoprotein-quinone oxidoreductase [Rhizobium esperanzae]MBB5261107.1 electron transfer flavoprotein-quinone oxidoreductase [Rhizobium leguminosarum]MBB6295935.1 electron transfer flavoprotein-quinone oxidoreductase [Rhizobium leguminosarum]